MGFLLPVRLAVHLTACAQAIKYANTNPVRLPATMNGIVAAREGRVSPCATPLLTGAPLCAMLCYGNAACRRFSTMLKGALQ